MYDEGREVGQLYMVDIFGSKHNRCSRCCSSHLLNRSKNRLMKGKGRCSSRAEYKAEEVNGSVDGAIYCFQSNK